MPAPETKQTIACAVIRHNLQRSKTTRELHHLELLEEAVEILQGHRRTPQGSFLSHKRFRHEMYCLWISSCMIVEAKGSQN